MSTRHLQVRTSLETRETMSSLTPSKSKPWSKGTATAASSSNTSVSKMKNSMPKLTSDSKHVPKTHGSIGLLVIGLGGANGTTMLAGILANRHNTKWYGPKGEGPIHANYNGCITQLNSKGVHGGVGYKDRVQGLADANMAVSGMYLFSFIYLETDFLVTSVDYFHIFILNRQLEGGILDLPSWEMRC